MNCPSCGAPVRFRSHASVMAVCEYCRAGVLKDASAVRDLGKIAEVLEDYSPIQLGTSGIWGKRPFTVVGRLQLRYDAGMWSEWHLLFDDGSSGWLGDASGQYTITTLRATAAPLPAFDSLAPGRAVTLDGTRYVAADVRTAHCVGGQGELPFVVGAGWQARVADLRAGTIFATLDYSDDKPRLYVGRATTLQALQCQLLRDDTAIEQTAGRYRGKLTALACPSCGSQIQYLPGLTNTLVCRACTTQLDATSPQVEVLRAGERVKAARTTLELGAEGKLGNQKLTIIGVLRRQDDEGFEWTEYLLYGPRAGFLWLVEAEGEWSKSVVLDDWPQLQETGARLNSVRFDKVEEYDATVTFAAGAFNWRVQVGDVTHIVEYERGPTSLAAESTAQELTWSKSTDVSQDQLNAWFGKATPARKTGKGRAAAGPKSGHRDTARWLIIIMVVCNAIPLLLNFRAAFIYTVIGAAALYLPAMFLDSMDNDA
ncbi:DUF4178 domain-containing protein [Pseudoduganella chitinolytica]|uniref:DUF4178 domain-containing protein n=1 Tax=Pseudoduganella chitinolytica TaxID=34070 RepID=A0ABY8BJ25_9BURK|nr:DUF4178 domain-containing protein [Pseudoduganella chitinolytica]WEF35986.1 DUF4178 domain-containing protein [Pseudoduganella chitinolytica]